MKWRAFMLMVVALNVGSSSFAQDAPDATARGGPSEEAAVTAPSTSDTFSLAHYHYTLALLRLSSSTTPSERLVMISELRTAIRLRPDFGEAHSLLGDVLLQSGDAEGALDEFRLAVRLRPGLPQTHLALANALIAKHDWKAAGAELKEVLRLDPSLAQAHFNLAGIEYTLGHPQQAIRAYQEALTLQPDFADAHYRLGLVLKLMGREKESIGELRKASEGGVARAQYFLGNSYRSGQGVGKNLAMAIWWWTRAFEQGLEEAGTALSQLRRTVLNSATRGGKQAATISLGFEEFPGLERQAYPDLDASAEGETVGTTLLKLGNSQDAVPALLREAYALNVPAQSALERLYLEGGGEGVPPHDGRIFQYLQVTAADGLIASKVLLARIYGKGLGVPRDLGKTNEYLRGLPDAEAKRVREELASETTGS